MIVHAARFVASLAALILSTHMVLAEADGPDWFAVTGVASDDVLNIREMPDAGSAKIGEIPYDAVDVRNLGCQGGLGFDAWQKASEAERAASVRNRWCRIDYRGTEGFVAGRFLTESSYVPAAEQPVADGSSWLLVSVNGSPVTGEATMTFAPDGGISGSTGCNRFQARGVLADGVIGLSGPVASTRMACPGDGLMRQESAILNLLQGRLAVAYDPFAGTIELSGDGGSMLLRRAP